MKRLFLVLLTTIFLFSCAGLQLTPTQEAGIHKVARIAGVTMAFKKPEKAMKLLSYIQYIKDPQTVFVGPVNLDTVLAAATENMFEKYGRTQENIIIAAEAEDTIKFIASMFPKLPDVEDAPALDFGLLNVALDGLEEGIKLAGPKVESKTRALRLL